MDWIASFTSDVVGKSLDGLALRHTAIASNLANVDTPGYKKKDVSFEDQLRAAMEARQADGPAQARNDRPLPMRASRPAHLALDAAPDSLTQVQPQMSEREHDTFRNDNNGVDVEGEMVSLARNTERYLALSNLQSRIFRSTRTVISNAGS